MANSNVNLKALGLNFQPNQLDVAPGSMVEADNVIIRRENVIEKRRGFKLYGDALGTGTDRAKQLFTYQNRIIRHYSNILQVDNGSGTFTNLPGTFVEPEIGIRIKSVVANNNFYFTSDNGIQKISAKNSDFDNATIGLAGGVKAIDVSAKTNYVYLNDTGFLPLESSVAYRVVWGIKDKNNNLILGSPSQRAEVYNESAPFIIRDQIKMLTALDSVASNPGGASINNPIFMQNFALPLSASASDIRTSLINLTTELDNQIYTFNPITITNAVFTLVNQEIVFTVPSVPGGLSVGDTIEVTGVIPIAYNKKYVIKALGLTTITVTESVDPGTYTSGGLIRTIKYGDITQPSEPQIIPNANDYSALQTYLLDIINTLQNEDIANITLSNLTTYITPLGITENSSVDVTVSIPDDVISAGVNQYFYQIYRSQTATATGVTVLSDLVPNDEMKLAYEGFPTQTELTAKTLTVNDNTPDLFLGAYLYTNQTTGEGILQSNEPPPLAVDINKFKNVIFYANTKLKQKKLLNLLGVSKIIDDYNASLNPSITIAFDGFQDTYYFVLGLKETTTIAATSGALLGGTYFPLNSANDKNQYYLWYQTGGDVDPAIPNKIGVQININVLDTANQIAQKTLNAIKTLPQDFTASLVTNTITVVNVDFGASTDATAGTTGFTVNVTQQGQGEDALNKKILLSSSASSSEAIADTALSLINVVNKTTGGEIYGFYLSGATDVPGKILFEGRNTGVSTFYLQASSSNVGTSFNPDISPINSGTISLTNPMQITTASHGLNTGDFVVLSGSNSPSEVNGYWVVTKVNNNVFTINFDATVFAPGSYSVKWSLSNDTESSDNEEKINRVYYSKLNQPEAVPIVNYFDVGASDKAILRIMPLRDSLFVFKEDGTFRISGELSPFSLGLFDSSTDIIAPDSLAIASNVIYFWTPQGISTMTEAGANIASRSIDTQILKIQNKNNYPNFKSATFGVGYESDSSYLVWTVNKPTDQYATICYRYCYLTDTWTTYSIGATCAVRKEDQDKLYIGAEDANYISEERKNFDRTDYADREYDNVLTIGSYYSNKLVLPSVTDIKVGDVITQTQKVTIYEYNMLLKKIDNDPGIITKNFYSTLNLSAGINIRTALIDLANKLDISGLAFTNYYSTISSKSGTITSQTTGANTQITSTAHGLVNGRIIVISGSTSNPSINGKYAVTVIDANTFSIPVFIKNPTSAGSWITDDENYDDVSACYNAIINKMNSDVTLNYSNYMLNNDITIQEAIVESINKITKTITLNLTLDFIVGPLVNYRGITSTIVYSPITFGDVLQWKQIYQATVMFENKIFTKAQVGFSNDLFPQFSLVDFKGDGNGIFGYGEFGSGFFGGGSHSAPYRTYVPREIQRCRAINLSLTHEIAREEVKVTGVSLTGRTGLSERAYRG